MTTLQERIQLYKDTNDFKKTERVPIQSACYAWQLLDAGMAFTDAFHDWDMVYNAICEHIERYEPDGINYTGTRYPFQIAEPLGASNYEYTENTINCSDNFIIQDDEFDEFMADNDKFLWEKGLCRKAKDADKDDSYERFLECIKRYGEFGAFVGKMNNKILNDYNIPIRARRHVQAPMEYLLNFYRGIKNLGIDLRRRKSKVIEIMDFIYQTEPGLKAYLEEYYNDETPNMISAYDLNIVFLSQNILSPKQFDELYWPFINELFSKSFDKGYRLDILLEGEIMRFTDYFQDVPKGHLNIHLEMDDIFEMRKKLPHICLTGGMPSTLLYSGTEQQCVDYAKKLIDEIGQDGGYVLSANKMLCYSNDCKRENLLAVHNFAKSYNA